MSHRIVYWHTALLVIGLGGSACAGATEARTDTSAGGASSAAGTDTSRAGATSAAGTDMSPAGGTGTGGGGAGGSMQAGASGGAPSTPQSPGGSSPAGTGGVAPAAGGSPTSSMGGSEAMPRHPLIVGGDACPREAPNRASCDSEGLDCVYQGIDSGLSATTRPMACRCRSSEWSCVSSDESGKITCPLDLPALTMEEPDGAVDLPCPSPPGLLCEYSLFDQFALAGCWCTGTASAPTGSWVCGV